MPHSRAKAPERGNGAQTLERGLDLLERVTRDPVGVADLAEDAGLTISTTRRLVAALMDRGFVSLGGKGKLRAGPKLIRLGSYAEAFTGPVMAARPHLEALTARTGLSSFLGRRDGDESVHLYRLTGKQRVIVATPVGTRRHLAETSLGKALLLDEGKSSLCRLFAAGDPHFVPTDWLEQMQENMDAGVVIHAGPAPDHIRAIAAPVRDASGEIVAAISIATVSQYLDRPQMAALAPLVRETAAAIGCALGWQAPLEQDKGGHVIAGKNGES